MQNAVRPINKPWVYGGLMLLYAFVLWVGEPMLAAGLHMLSRVAYFLFVSLALKAQLERSWFTERYGVERGWERFREIAEPIMNNDAFTLVLLGWMTRGAFPEVLPLWLRVSAGVALIVVGITVKVWAARELGTRGYYWYDFFAPGQTRRVLSGPYRLFKDPMYTVGYAHAYGAMLVLGSGLGLVGAMFDQALILLLNALVETPHSRRLYRDGMVS